VTACRAAGIRLAADDVGAGNAGLRLLSQLKFDIVKIDLSLVQGGAVRATSQEVVRTLKDLADRWGALVIAEGIETPEQLAFVRSLGIRAGQGYLLGRPAEQPSTEPVDLAGLVSTSGDWLLDRMRAGAPA
jgi:EAL domain-containing protein (putative c-di-GMP-specific phosphodiesterase class I)